MDTFWAHRQVLQVSRVVISLLIPTYNNIPCSLCSGNTGMTAVTWREGQQHCADQGEGGNLAAIPDRWSISAECSSSLIFIPSCEQTFDLRSARTRPLLLLGITQSACQLWLWSIEGAFSWHCENFTRVCWQLYSDHLLIMTLFVPQRDRRLPVRAAGGRGGGGRVGGRQPGRGLELETYLREVVQSRRPLSHLRI